MTDERQTGNKLVGIGRITINVLSRNFPEATEKNCEKLQSGQSIYRSKLEPGTSHLQIYSVTAKSTCW